MNANEYQKLAGRTLIDKPDNLYTPEEIMLVWNAIGLAGEAGEVADTVKKIVFHRHEMDREKLIKELGDVLWYVAALCTKLDVGMEEVMTRNIDKLIQRYPSGYSAEASQKRADVIKPILVELSGIRYFRLPSNLEKLNRHIKLHEDFSANQIAVATGCGLSEADRFCELSVKSGAATKRIYFSDRVGNIVHTGNELPNFPINYSDDDGNELQVDSADSLITCEYFIVSSEAKRCGWECINVVYYSQDISSYA